MSGSVSTINHIEKFRHNARPDAKATDRVEITVENHTDAKQGFFDARGSQVMLKPGEMRTVVVAVKQAFRLLANGRLTLCLD